MKVVSKSSRPYSDDTNISHSFEGDSKDPKARLKWQSVDNSLFELDEHTMLVRAAQILGVAHVAKVS